MKLRIIAALFAALAASTVAPVAAGGSSLSIPPATAMGMRIVVLHNQLRSNAGVQPVTWDRALAAAADAYAAELAGTGRWGHSSQAARPGQGENLWMGTRGAFNVDQMVGSWASEGRLFRSGAFPAVSRSGNWEDVGHYTQMIWPGSVRVGCAIRSSASNDYLVCRYSPAGNVMGAIVP